MKQSFITFGDKVLAWVDRLQKRLEGSTVYISAFLTVSLLVSGVWGTVNGQAAEGSTAYFDVNESYETQMKKVYSATGDEGQNVQTLDESSRLSSGINLLGDLVGIEAYGPEAVKRGEGLNLPESTRIGLLGVVDNEVMALAYNPPGVDLGDHLARQWIPGYEENVMATYAQGGGGEGYAFLQNNGIEQLWGFMRNIAYGIFVVIVMAAGFMVMFRSKLASGQAVSVMNALPGIFIGLILVTFSFAIVGFILDIGRLLSMIVASSMQDLVPGKESVFIGDPVQMIKEAFGTTMGGSMVPWVGTSLLGGGTGIVAGGLAVAGGLGSFLKVFLAPAATLVGLIALVVLLVIAAIAGYAVIRVYVALVMAYIKILIELVFSPLYIVLGSLPGRSDAFMQWIKRVFSHVLVFPVVIFILNIANYIRLGSVDLKFNESLKFLSGTTGGLSDIIQLRGIFVIAIYFMAAGAPAIVTEIMGAAESKGVGSMFENTKKAAGKIPVVGGLFGG